MLDRYLDSFTGKGPGHEHDLAVGTTGQSLAAGDESLGQHSFDFTLDELIGHVGSVGGIVGVPTHLPEGRS